MGRQGGAKRLPVLLGLALLLLLGLLHPHPPRAQAHGGQFRAPGVPPSGPGLGPIPVPQNITPGETWQTWWDLNRMGLIPGRDIAVRRREITPRGETPISPEEAWSRQRLAASRNTIVPFLLRLVDPRRKTRDEVRAAALIALGKISERRIVHPILVQWLHDPKANEVIGESAALGIGLLRRSKPSLQREGKDLDGLRDELLKAVADRDRKIRPRAFAALALGLLADQPYGTPYAKDGLLVVRALWKTLPRSPRGIDIPIAILTAIGMHARTGVPDEVLEGLEQITNGKTLFKRRWSPAERSHAFTAAMSLNGPGAYALLLRVIRRRAEKVELRRAAYLALGRLSEQLTDEERAEIAKALPPVLKFSRDPLTHGLGVIAAGRLLATDLREGKIGVLEAANLPKLLLDTMNRGTSEERGWATVALALAARGAKDSGVALPLQERTKTALLDGLVKGRGDDRLKSCYAAGLGILDVADGVDPLLAVVEDSHADPVFRGHAAVALGQMGRRADEVRPALIELLREKRGVLLRVRAAMALALLGGTLTRTELLQELKEASSEYHLAHVVIALGRLGDLAAVPDLLEYTKDDKRTELARALAVVALGLLTDPEPRPSILRLTEDSNYPAATSVLYSAYAIF